MNVKIIKMVTGEDLITEVKKTTNDSYIIKNPCVLIPTKEGYGIAPWAFMCKDAETGLELSKDKVVFIASPHDDFANQYNSAFGSGVVAPKKKIITPSDLKLTP
jgi:hypothetical protein